MNFDHTARIFSLTAPIDWDLMWLKLKQNVKDWKSWRLDANSWWVHGMGLN